jgi:hypothetical protein
MPGLSMINRCAFIALLSVATATAADVQTAVGEVDSVQLVDATSLGGETFLIVVLADGRSFQLPDERQIAAGQGVRLEIRYLAPDEPDLLPEACSATVLAIPIMVDDEEVMREAERPFEVFRNPRPECGKHSPQH